MEIQSPVRRKVGKPPIPDEVIEAVVCDVEDGMYVTAACSKHGIGRVTLTDRAQRAPEIKARLAAACEAKGEQAADEVASLAQEALNAWRNGREDISGMGVIIKAKQWEAEKRASKKFGQKMAVDTTTTHRIDDAQMAAALASMSEDEAERIDRAAKILNGEK